MEILPRRGGFLFPCLYHVYRTWIFRLIIFMGQPTDLSRPGSAGPERPGYPATILEKGRIVKNIFMAYPTLTSKVLIDDLAASSTQRNHFADSSGLSNCFFTLVDIDGHIAFGKISGKT